MNAKNMAALAAVLALAAGTMLAAGNGTWMALASQTPRRPDCRLTASTPDLVSYEVTVNGLERSPVDTKGGRFLLLTLPEHGYNTAIGQPKLPVISQWVEIPQGAAVTPSLQVLETAEIDLGTERIAPVQPPVAKLPGAGDQVPFAIDDAIYGADAAFGGPALKVSDPMQMRARRAVLVSFWPVSYNPVSGRIRVVTKARIGLALAGSDGAATDAVLRTYGAPAFDKYVASSLLNPRPSGAKLVPAAVVNELVIVADSLLTALQPLLDWDNRRGYRLTVTKTSQVPGGSDTTHILSYIQSQYNGANPPLFVLLVGDVNTIPAFSSTETDNPVNDLKYSLLAGSDLIPDVQLGRICVENTTQLGNYITKYVQYSTGGWGASTAWMAKAYFTGSDDGSYHGVAEGTDNYCMARCRAHGMTCDSLYAYYGTGTPVATAFNNGRTVMSYTGHGSETGWAGPSFGQSNVNALTNTYMYAFVTSFACLTGKYNYSPECYGETWIRAANKGSIAYWGSSVYSYWDEDDILQRRLYDALLDTGYTWLGGMTVKAKVDFGRYYNWTSGPSVTVKRYLQEYNLLGSPAIDMYTAQPATMAVTHPAVAPVGPSVVNVTVTAGGPVKDALVCIMLGTSKQILGTAYSDAAGNAAVSIDPGLVDSLALTVTAHNCAPYLGQMQVSSSGAYVCELRHSVDDAAGNGDGIANPGETVRLPIWIKNFGSSAASGVVGTLRSAGANGTVTADSVYAFGTLAAGDSAQYAAGFGVSVNPADTNGMTIPLTLECRDASDSVWTSNLSVTVGAAALASNGRTIGGNGRLDPNKSSRMAVCLKNNGSGYGYNVSAVLRCGDPLVTVTDSTASYGTIAPAASGTSGTDSFALSIGAVAAGSSVGFTLVMKADGAADRSYSWNEPVGDLRYAVTPDNSTPVYYAAEDSDDVSRAPVYSWAEIRGVGTALSALLADDADASITLPFTFKWYGTGYTALTACSNGWIGFGSNSSTAYSNTTVPTTTFATPAVFAAWDDLNGLASAAPSAWVGYYSDAANHRLIVEYDSIVFYGTTSRLKFQVIYYDSTASSPYYDVVLQYAMLSDQGSSSIGFQQNGTVGAQLLYNAAYAPTMLPLQGGRAVRLTRYPNGATGVTAPAQPAAALPLDYQLGRARPNPARGPVTIGFALPRPVTAELAVYNLMGQKVRTLAQGPQAAGYHTVTWDGTAGDGRLAAGGIYFYRLVTPDHRETRRLVYLR